MMPKTFSAAITEACQREQMEIYRRMVACVELDIKGNAWRRHHQLRIIFGQSAPLATGQGCACGIVGCPVGYVRPRASRDRTRGYKWRAGTRMTKRHSRARKTALGGS